MAEARSSELRFLLVHHNKVSDEIQGELYQNGIDTAAKLATPATDSFAIDPVASLKMRAQATRVVVCWKTAITRLERQAEAEATSEVWDTAKPIPSTDYMAMTSAAPLKSTQRRSWRSSSPASSGPSR